MIGHDADIHGVDDRKSGWHSNCRYLVAATEITIYMFR